SVATPAPRLVHADLAVAATAAGVLILLATFVLWPVLKVLWLSVAGAAGLTLANYEAFFSSSRLARILVNSLAVATVSTALTVLIALVLAYAVTRTTIRGKRFVSLMALLPLISPPFLVSLAFILLFGRNGLVTHGLGLDWSIYGFTGIVVAQIFTFLPPAYILLANVLGNMDAALEEAAENLGAGPLTTLRRVTLSLARPGLASAATMSVILIVPCLLAYVLNTYWVGSRSYVTVTAGARAAVRPTPPALRWPLTVVAAGFALFTAVTYALIPLGSLVRLWGSDWSLSLKHYTFASTAEGPWPIWNR